jgi:hypothetical protein
MTFFTEMEKNNSKILKEVQKTPNGHINPDHKDTGNCD